MKSIKYNIVETTWNFFKFFGFVWLEFAAQLQQLLLRFTIAVCSCRSTQIQQVYYDDFLSSFHECSMDFDVTLGIVTLVH